MSSATSVDAVATTAGVWPLASPLKKTVAVPAKMTAGHPSGVLQLTRQAAVMSKHPKAIQTADPRAYEPRTQIWSDAGSAPMAQAAAKATLGCKQPRATGSVAGPATMRLIGSGKRLSLLMSLSRASVSATRRQIRTASC